MTVQDSDSLEPIRNSDADLPPAVPELEDTVHEAVSEDFDRTIYANEIKEIADKLVRDQATRGDLKVLTRALRELRYAFKVFKPLRRRRKITVFGSARTPPSHPDYEQARLFGEKMGDAGWMVVTGAGNGIMEAGHVGAGRELSIGVNIMLPFEQSANPVIEADEKLIHLKYFFTRKLLFVKEVHGIALFPGGFGTLDEGFEILTLVQTGKHDLMPIVCVDKPGGTYWSAWKKFVEEQLLERGLISPEDMSLFKVTDNVDEAVREITGFYSVYDSMRYVRKKLVLRLYKEPTSELIERLNTEFRDIIEAGDIERVGAHRLEADDPHLEELPRLAFQFTRKHLGRLRQMVDVINRELAPPE